MYSMFCWLPMFFLYFVNDTRPPLLVTKELTKLPPSQLPTSLRPIPTQHLQPGAHFDYMLPKAAVVFCRLFFHWRKWKLMGRFQKEAGGCEV